MTAGRNTPTYTVRAPPDSDGDADIDDRPTTRPAVSPEVLAFALMAAAPQSEPPLPSDSPEPAAMGILESTPVRSRADTVADCEPDQVLGEQKDSDIRVRLEEMDESFASGRYEDALAAADKVLAAEPNHDGATSYAESCREILEQIYLLRIGGPSVTLKVIADRGRVRWVSRDPRMAFLLSLAEMGLTVNEIVEACGQRRLEALRALAELVDEQVVREE